MCAQTTVFDASAWSVLLVLLSTAAVVGCNPDPVVCESDADCRYDRKCHSERQVCVWPENAGVPPPPDVGNNPDAGDRIYLFRDEFDDRDLDGWNAEHRTRSESFKDDVVVFAGTKGRGRDDSKARWTTSTAISNLRGVKLTTRFKMKLEKRGRDQNIGVQVRFLTSKSSASSELGRAIFYTRWEGKNGTLSERCRADDGRGWCSYWGKRSAVREDGTEYYRDARARNRWSRVGASLERIVRERLDGVDAGQVGALKIVIRSRGAWGRTSLGVFDYVRIFR